MSLTPPRPTPVPLNALRAAEAAIRHRSFQRAAEELSVSPGAIAQHIRKLEDWAGADLFQRLAQGVAPTPLAEHLLGDLTAGFAQIGAVARIFRQAATSGQVRIAALPAIAQLWLGPRMAALQEAMPSRPLSVHALDTCPPLLHGTFDLALYPADSAPSGARALAPNGLIPVAAPALARTLSTPADLTEAVLIHDSAWHGDWGRWLASQGLALANTSAGPVYSLYSLAVERCLAGDGVLMGHTALVGPLIADGRLETPFPGTDLPGPALSLAKPQGSAALDPLIQALTRLAVEA